MWICRSLIILLSCSLYADQELPLLSPEMSSVCDTPVPIEVEETAVICNSLISPLIEIKGGYFIFAESKMRKIYHKGGFDVQASISYPVWRWLQVYGSAEFMMASGKSLSAHDRTTIWTLPFSLGLRPTVALCDWIQYYFTLGPRYVYVHQANHSPYLDKNPHKNGFGGFANTGFSFYLKKHFVIDLFGEYSYVKVHCPPHKTNVYGEDAQIGGFVVGLGLGYGF